MSQKTVLVRSSACTHVLPDEGLVLEGGRETEIPTRHLARVLQLDGVSAVLPTTPEPEPEA